MREPFQPDLVSLAQQQFATAHRLCAGCLPYHSLWPYLRLSRLVGGVEADRPQLLPLLHGWLGAAACRVLVAGSADTGLTALLHEAAGSLAARHTITVVDRCETPLAACRNYGAAHGLALNTTRADLRELHFEACFDLVVGHSILPFLDADGRHAALAALQRALAPGGRLVLTTRLAAAGQADGPSPVRWPKWAAEHKAGLDTTFARLGIPRPASRQAFEALVERYTQLDNRGAPHATPADLERELAAAGFQVADWLYSGKGTAFLDSGKVDSSARQGVIAVTRAKES